MLVASQEIRTSLDLHALTSPCFDVAKWLMLGGMAEINHSDRGNFFPSLMFK